MRHILRFRVFAVPSTLLCLALLSACREGVMDPHGPVSRAERLILLNATGIMLVVVLPVILMTLAFAWWFRASNTRAVYRPNWSYSGQIELVVWAVPAMVVLLLAGVTWIGSHQLDPGLALQSTVKPLRIQVVSLDWKWLFIYPQQQVATVNQLIVPAGTPLELSLTSASVMNAFFIPQLGSQIYTMPGMTSHLNLLADQPGEYPGLSSHFSGDGFSDMRFFVHAVNGAAFAAWVEQAHRDAPAMNVAAYEVLSVPTIHETPQTFGSVDAALYEYILHKAAPMAASSPEDR